MPTFRNYIFFQRAFLSIATLMFLLLPGHACKNGGKDAGRSGQVQDTTFFDTLGIDKNLRAGKVFYLNKKKIQDNLILVNDGSRNNRVYLMDKNAKVVHEWPLARNIGKDVTLMPDGRLLAMMMVDSTDINFGGQAGIVQILEKDGSAAWEFVHASDDYITHHDAEMLPNGNILTLVWERKTAEEASKAGSILGIAVYPEAIIEIDPETNSIVWQWHAWDHLVQEADAKKENFGSIAENPGLIDLNYVTDHKGDIMHANGLTYDPARDLIFLTINWFSEVWVIDHSTSTEEAASHAGGNYNKGGDLVYRFGNPSAYKNSKGKQLFDYVHTPQFVEHTADPYSNLLVFSNRLEGKEQSKVYEFDLSGEFSLQPHTDNEPELVWSFTHPELYGGRISGAVRQENGNTLIAEGDYGLWEVSPEQEVVWKFQGEGEFFWRAYPIQRDAEALKPILNTPAATQRAPVTK